jgi:UDP-N-acetylglucosamine 2-epimerase (non-hydrolysing)
MIHVVIGTKAQLIKMAPVMKCLAERGIEYNFISTGQHRETMRDMLEDFELKGPDVVLYSGPDIVSIPAMLAWGARILWKSFFQRKKIFGTGRHGIVLVHGDTFSTLLGALMGRFAGLRVGHVESGLRSFNIFHPFPEELTRILTFRLSHILFCPGPWALDNVKSLKKQKIDTGTNTMSDTLAMISRDSRRQDHVPDFPFGLVSIHRYENIFKERKLLQIIDFVEQVARKHYLLFILHPPTEKRLRKTGLYDRLESNPRIELRARYPYFDFTVLLKNTQFVVTDGGSLQEETHYLGIPCLLVRKATERMDGVGRNVVLSKYDAATIDNFTDNYLKYRYPPLSRDIHPSAIIVDAIQSYQ